MKGAALIWGCITIGFAVTLNPAAIITLGLTIYFLFN